MKKDIKNYLQFLIGCTVRSLDGGTMEYKLVGIDQDGKPLFKTRSAGGFNIFLNNWKPVLRPIYDMTVGEAEELATIVMDSPRLDKSSRITKGEVIVEVKYPKRKHYVVRIEVSCRCWEGTLFVHANGDLYLREEDEQKNQPIDFQAEKVVWLLSKEFDVFGLINAGIAIDKTEGK